MARPRGFDVAAAAWLLLQLCGVARSGEISVSPAPKYDACVFLNALSEDPRFSGGYEEDRRLWLPAIRKDPELSRAFDLWRGRGVELAHLLSATPESPDGIAEALRRAPEDLYARIEARLAEPAYEKSFAFLKAHSAELIRVLDHLRVAGFPAYWEKRAKGEAAAKSAAFQSILSRDLGPGALADASRFVGKDLSPSELCVTFFSGPFSFALAGGGACLSIETELYEAVVTALHEYLHAFNPDPETLRLQDRLREGDEFYAAAARRIYEAGGKGREEEFVQAAELYASVRAGLRSHKEALRQARFVDGGLLTPPVHLYGVDHVNPSAGPRYTKPIVLLVNELDFSGGDFFPAILQDNRRAVVFGMRTAGAGGFVNSVNYPNLLGVGEISMTGSIAERPIAGKPPIENLGVTPDVEYALTAEDLQDGFQGYRRAVNEVVAGLVGTTGRDRPAPARPASARDDRLAPRRPEQQGVPPRARQAAVP